MRVPSVLAETQPGMMSGFLTLSSKGRGSTEPTTVSHLQCGQILNQEGKTQLKNDILNIFWRKGGKGCVQDHEPSSFKRPPCLAVYSLSSIQPGQSSQRSCKLVHSRECLLTAGLCGCSSCARCTPFRGNLRRPGARTRDSTVLTRW